MAGTSEGKSGDSVCKGHLQWHMISFIIIVLYILFGGIIFKLTESSPKSQQDSDEQPSISNDNFTLVVSDRITTKSPTVHDDVDVLRIELIRSLHGLWSNDTDAWTTKAIDVLKNYERQLSEVTEIAEESEYNGFNNWFNSCFFCLTVVTTIGYGHMIPHTSFGKFFFTVYSVIGIPLFFLYIFKLGEHLSIPTKKVYWYIRCVITRLWSISPFGGRSYETNEQFRQLRNPVSDDPMVYKSDLENIAEEDEDGGDINSQSEIVERQTTDTLSGRTTNLPDTTIRSNDPLSHVDVPIFALLLLILVYVLIFSAIFCALENWNYGSSLYFSMVTLTTIGFGDLLPTHDSAINHFVVFVYIVCGMLIMSVCINLVWKRAARFANWIFYWPCLENVQCCTC